VTLMVEKSRRASNVAISGAQFSRASRHHASAAWWKSFLRLSLQRLKNSIIIIPSG
jgi:hypothetical protein